MEAGRPSAPPKGRLQHTGPALVTFRVPIFTSLLNFHVTISSAYSQHITYSQSKACCRIPFALCSGRKKLYNGSPPSYVLVTPPVGRLIIIFLIYQAHSGRILRFIGWHHFSCLFPSPARAHALSAGPSNPIPGLVLGNFFVPQARLTETETLHQTL